MFAGIAIGSSACLSIELSTMFSDHAVLQRGEAVPVWGWGEGGSEIVLAPFRPTSLACRCDPGKTIIELKDGIGNR